MSLTVTQSSALAELRKRGVLRPSARAWGEDGHRAFSRKTLQALIDEGHADWWGHLARCRLAFPPVENLDFNTCYMDPALFDLQGVIDRARSALADVHFDTLVGAGFSGSIVIPSLALALGKRFVLVRKESDDSHHGSGRLLGSLGLRWVFVDDFVSSGHTRRRCARKIAESVANDGRMETTWVGQYTYVLNHKDQMGFEPFSDGWF